MEKMKKFAALLLVALSIFTTSAASIAPEGFPNPFPSRENLLKFDFSEEVDNRRYEDINIYLVSTEGGDQVYALFGHTSMEIELPGYFDNFYDYGFFTFKDGFYMNFALGKLYYNIYRTDAMWRMETFRSEDRTVHKTLLPLTPSQKKGIIAFLDYNSLPENNTYLYDYYRDNCATRVRDIMDEATGGEFKAWSDAIPSGESFRSSSNHYMEAQFFPAFAINYLEGPKVDRLLSRWDMMYLPEELMKGAEEFFDVVTNIAYRSETRTPYKGLSLLQNSVIFGVFLFILIYLESSIRKKGLRRTIDIVMGIFYILLFVMSSVLLFMMVFTNHDVTYMNENILFLNPLIILFAFDAFRGKDFKRRKTYSLFFSAVIAVLLLLKGFMPTVFIQDNMSAIAVTLLIYLGNITAYYVEREKLNAKSDK